MPLIGTRGAASAQGFGEFAQSAGPVYIEDVFSTYVYTGTGATQTITNGIDFSTYGGLLWSKSRNDATGGHFLSDSARGINNTLSSQSTAGNTLVTYYGSFSTSGYSLSSNAVLNGTGGTFGPSYVSWSFRKQPKFFDVVTFSTGASTNTNLRISHNLGSVPGCMILKRTDGAGDWPVWHRSLASATDSSLNLNLTGAVTTRTNTWGTSGPTSTDFGIDNTYFGTNANYVAYLFAHNAGGFGLAGTDSVISCGTFTETDSGVINYINVGFESQWILMKPSSGVGDWLVVDNMRGWVGVGSTINNQALRPNTAGAEFQRSGSVGLTATGFAYVWGAGQFVNAGRQWIYVAIRRGPMKTPTTGASVFEPAFSTANSPEYKSNTVISGFDSAIAIYRPGYSDANFSYPYTATRLQQAAQILQTARANTEYTYSGAANFVYNTGWFNSTFGNDTNRESYMFKRAPGFHDLVCYTGNGAASLAVSHNLGVAPEMIIIKSRTGARDWAVYAGSNTSYLVLNTTASAFVTSTAWNNTSPTSTNFTVGNNSRVNTSNEDLIAYLFASCPGVSKVGSYTGTGANQTINCGFASGVRFVLIKRTDSTGDWYVYDTTRGMTSGTDPYIPLNSVAAEVTGTNYVETIATGFRLIGSNAGTNANGGTYIYLAIA